jgi:hypothetical protein
MATWVETTGALPRCEPRIDTVNTGHLDTFTTEGGGRVFIEAFHPSDRLERPGRTGGCRWDSGGRHDPAIQGWRGSPSRSLGRPAAPLPTPFASRAPTSPSSAWTARASAAWSPLANCPIPLSCSTRITRGRRLGRFQTSGQQRRTGSRGHVLLGRSPSISGVRPLDRSNSEFALMAAHTNPPWRP